MATRAGSDLPPLPRGRRGHAVCAHRGDSGALPENTATAITSAIRVGADLVEIDIRSTADGEIVVHHDKMLTRTTDVASVHPRQADEPASGFALDELRQLDAGGWNDPVHAGERLLTLTEALALVHGTGAGLVIEFKQHDAAFIDQVLDVVDGYDGGPIVLGAIPLEVATVINERMTARGRWYTVGVMAQDPTADETEIARWAEVVSWVGMRADVIHAVDRQRIAAVAPHLRISHNTSSRSAMIDSVAAGADATMTDYPQRSREVVDQITVITVEAEDGATSSTGRDEPRPTGRFLNGGKLSGLGEHTWRALPDAAVGDWLELPVELAATGSYEIPAVLVGGAGGARLSITVDDATPVMIDTARPKPYPSGRITVGLGRHELAAGAHRVRFTVAEGSAEPATLGVDVVELVAA